MPPLIVEFIGRAASGKTTICESVAEKLRGHGLATMVSLPSAPVSPLRVAARPRLAWAAWRLAALTQKEFEGRFWSGHYLRRLHSIDMLGDLTADVVLTDQGLIKTLHNLARPPSEAVLSALPLPHAVVRVSAPLHEINGRLVAREEGDPSKMGGASGARRWRWAVRRASILLPQRGPERTADFLRWWGQRCVPPLSDHEVDAVLCEARGLDPASAAQLGRGPVLRPLLEGRGCHWIEVQNPDARPADAAASEVVDRCRPLIAGPPAGAAAGRSPAARGAAL